MVTLGHSPWSGHSLGACTRCHTVAAGRMRGHMAEWSFLSNHARVLVCIAHDPGVRLRDIATTLGITERSAFGIVNDLAEAGYVVKDKDGRRNRYQVQGHLPLREAIGREATIGQVLALLVDTNTKRARGSHGCRLSHRHLSDFNGNADTFNSSRHSIALMSLED